MIYSLVTTNMYQVRIYTLITRAETNTNTRDYLIILVVFVKKYLVSNAHYIILWRILA